MIALKKEGVLVNKTALKFEGEGVSNPAVIREDGSVHLFYRAVSQGNYSSIGYCKLEGPLSVVERMDVPILFPQFDYESHGVEDPRITKIDGLYYLTYTAFDGINALGALAVSTDLIHFTKKGIIVPMFHYEEFKHLAGCKNFLNEKYVRFNDRGLQVGTPDSRLLVWDKNVVFFPRRIKGMLCFLHRIRPDIQIVYVKELSDLTKDFWAEYFLHLEKKIVLISKYAHEVSYIGSGCPPIETAFGWLLIYHGVHDTTNGYVYSACAALLELENPEKEIVRLPYPLFFPEETWETKGVVNNVCFPTGTAVFDDTLFIYYGAADERVACASTSLSELLKELLSNVK